MLSTLKVEKKGYIGTISLNRPEKRNTFIPKMAEELNQSLLQFENDSSIRVILLMAEGEHFSMGIALQEFEGKKTQELRRFLQLMDMHNHTIARMVKPVMCAVQGYAVANGAGLAVACDLTVAADNLKIGTTAINVGLFCLGPASPIIRTIGRKKTVEMVLRGKTYNATEARGLGLVNEVVPLTDLRQAAFQIAEEMAEKSPLAIQIGKRGLYALDNLSYHEGIDYMSELFAGLCSTEDAQSGIRAFLEKRKPEWKGK